MVKCENQDWPQTSLIKAQWLRLSTKEIFNLSSVSQKKKAEEEEHIQVQKIY